MMNKEFTAIRLPKETANRLQRLKIAYNEVSLGTVTYEKLIDLLIKENLEKNLEVKEIFNSKKI